ncbi:MAG: metalloregulator ArsR/SmtB family transcription factor [Clostridia bacterium]|nr:metalloregulator ArsR/SmtB family transcription factor [Clostridia bacterium]
MKNAAIELLKALSDGTRLDIINILAKQDSYVEQLAATLSLAPATVCYHLKKMEQVGLVTSARSQFYIIYSLNQKAFDRTLRELVICPARVPDADEKYRREVLEHFFRYGKLTTIPVQRKKREIVLQKLLERFAVGIDYTEREVSEILAEYHEDYCTLRREMIACGLMTRDHEIYRVVQKDDKT